MSKPDFQNRLRHLFPEPPRKEPGVMAVVLGSVVIVLLLSGIVIALLLTLISKVFGTGAIGTMLIVLGGLGFVILAIIAVGGFISALLK